MQCLLFIWNKYIATIAFPHILPENRIKSKSGWIPPITKVEQFDSQQKQCSDGAVWYISSKLHIFLKLKRIRNPTKPEGRIHVDGQGRVKKAKKSTDLCPITNNIQ